MVIGRRPVRRYILKLRDVCGAVVQHEGEEAVFVQAETPEGMVYQPLAHIQGRSAAASPARWGEKRRWSMCRTKRFGVRYNPRVEGECLFACAKFILKAQHKVKMTVGGLRLVVQQELQRIHMQGELISGHPLCYWSEQLGVSVETLIERTTGTQI
eukprot:2634894-Amphidinium_carterae.3